MSYYLIDTNVISYLCENKPAVDGIPAKFTNEFRIKEILRIFRHGAVIDDSIIKELKADKSVEKRFNRRMSKYLIAGSYERDSANRISKVSMKELSEEEMSGWIAVRNFQLYKAITKLEERVGFNIVHRKRHEVEEDFLDYFNNLGYKIKKDGVISENVVSAIRHLLTNCPITNNLISFFFMLAMNIGGNEKKKFPLHDNMINVLNDFWLAFRCMEGDFILLTSDKNLFKKTEILSSIVGYGKKAELYDFPERLNTAWRSLQDGQQKT